jgi:hypothetical protein
MFNRKVYAKKENFDYIYQTYNDTLYSTIIEVEEIHDVSESDGSSFYIPCWQVDLLNGDYIRIENMHDLVVIYSKNTI